MPESGDANELTHQAAADESPEVQRQSRTKVGAKNKRTVMTSYDTCTFFFFRKRSCTSSRTYRTWYDMILRIISPVVLEDHPPDSVNKHETVSDA